MESLKCTICTKDIYNNHKTLLNYVLYDGSKAGTGCLHCCDYNSTNFFCKKVCEKCNIEHHVFQGSDELFHKEKDLCKLCGLFHIDNNIYCDKCSAYHECNKEHCLCCSSINMTLTDGVCSECNKIWCNICKRSRMKYAYHNGVTELNVHCVFCGYCHQQNYSECLTCSAHVMHPKMIHCLNKEKHHHIDDVKCCLQCKTCHRLDDTAPFCDNCKRCIPYIYNNQWTHNCTFCNKCHSVWNKKYCEKCKTCDELSEHCDLCNRCNCTRYNSWVHCELCGRCNDASFKHCSKCGRCHKTSFIVHCSICKLCYGPDYKLEHCTLCKTCHSNDDEVGYKYCLTCDACHHKTETCWALETK